MLGKIYLISKSTMRYIKITALLAVVLLILSACGQRGALYIPKVEPVKTSPTQSESGAPEKAPENKTSTTTEGA